MSAEIEPVTNPAGSSSQKQNPNAITGLGGLPTPTGSEEPDAARNDADQRRRANVGQASGADADNFATTRSQHPDEVSEVSDVIQEVLKCDDNEHRKILGVKPHYDDPYKEEADILDAVNERGNEANPKHNKHKDAELVFKKILAAGRALGVGDDQIKEVEDWEGEDDESDMEGVEKEVPYPHPRINEIYQKATPALGQLQKNPKSRVACKQLDELNNQIQTLNKGDGIDADQWVINYGELSEIYKKALPAIETLRKNLQDQDAKTELEKQREALQHIIDRRRYLNWNIDMSAFELPEDVNAPSADTTQSTAPNQTLPSTGQTVVPEVTQSTVRQSLAPVNPLGESVLPEPVRKLQTEVLQLWGKMGWSTHKTSDGYTILSYKSLSREGKDPYGYDFTVMMNESPYFAIKTGSEIGRDNTNSYFAFPNAHRRQTDPGEKGTPVYTFRDKARFVRLVFTATKPRKQTTVGGKPRAGETQCCVEWKDGGVSEMSRAQFRKVTTEDEKKAVERYAKSVNVPLPQDIDPKGLFIPTNTGLGRDLLRDGRAGSLINFKAPAPSSVALTSTSVAGSGNLQDPIASLQASLQSMQEQIASQQKLLMDMQLQIQKQQDQMQQNHVAQLEFNASLVGILKNNNLMPKATT